MRRFLLIVSLLIGISHAGTAQLVNTGDPREIALELFAQISRGAPPDAISLRLDQLIPIFRMRCLRLTDFQVFSLKPNIAVLKVKCSGDPLYGVTVASNGYVSVYGGNGLIETINPRDGQVYTIPASGEAALLAGPTVQEAVKENAGRIATTRDELIIFIVAALVIILVAVLGLRLWLKIWRRVRQGSTIKQHSDRSVTTSEPSFKDDFIAQSTRTSWDIHLHPSGIYIARGSKGRRRFFRYRISAYLYRHTNWRLFEVPEQTAHSALAAVSGSK